MKENKATEKACYCEACGYAFPGQGLVPTDATKPFIEIGFPIARIGFNRKDMVIDHIQTFFVCPRCGTMKADLSSLSFDHPPVNHEKIRQMGTEFYFER